MAKKSYRHITANDERRIVEFLDGWKGQITWEALSDACEQVINTKPSRQTLSKIPSVVEAYKSAKERAKEADKETSVPPTLRVAGERIDRLANENERLKREIATLYEQFVRWQYNAALRGLSEEFLNQPLPGIDRGQTE